MIKNVNKIAIMGRMTLEAHSLNNEGNIGNVIQPREVCLSDGSVRNAISGEMLKHYHSRNLYQLSDQDELCNTCKIFSPMRNGDIKQQDKNLSASGNRVKDCIIDDIHGFMNAGKGNEKRKSIINFSWAIATEDREYQSMIHSRVDNTQKNNNKKDKEDTTGDGNTNTKQNTQMIYHRPLNSNEYAFTIVLELDRIGFDDEKLIYTISEEERNKRIKKCIKALRNMFLDMEGAMCSTTLPHIANLEGIVAHKKDREDVLVKYTALEDNYKEVNSRLATNSIVFNNIEEFAEVISNIE